MRVGVGVNSIVKCGNGKWSPTSVEMPGIEPGASRMRSERSTTELHPLPTPVSQLRHLLCDTTRLTASIWACDMARNLLTPTHRELSPTASDQDNTLCSIIGWVGVT